MYQTMFEKPAPSFSIFLNVILISLTNLANGQTTLSSASQTFPDTGPPQTTSQPNATLTPSQSLTTRDIDDCVQNPCKNGGNCTDLVNGYNCTCAAGWSGDMCDTDIDDCVQNPCKNGGNCTDLVNGYNCTCAAGWSGDMCNTDIDDCVQNPCKNGGNCTDLVNGYNCTCAAGWSGDMCDTDIDDCVQNPCKNGGKCSDLVNGYNCTCAAGWSGDMCNTDIDDCVQNPCKNGGNCTDLVNGYNCTCAAGWSGDMCDTDIDDCLQNPCKNGGKCSDLVNGYNCTCASGWSGDMCDTEIPLLPHSGSGFKGDDDLYGPYYLGGNLIVFGKIFVKVYVSMNGYITFQPFSQFLPVKYSLPKETTILAPFWADIDSTGASSGSLLIKTYKNCSRKDAKMLARISEVVGKVGFYAQNAIVATWQNVSPYPSAEFESEKITFQAVVASDLSKLYAVFLYAPVVMKWNRNANKRKILIGYTLKNEVIATTQNNTEIQNVFDMIDEGKTKIVIHLGNITSSKDQNSSICVDWHCRAKERGPVDTEGSLPCPCTSYQAERDFRYTNTTKYRGMTTNAKCFKTIFPTNNIITECCYYDKSGALNTQNGGYSYPVSDKENLKSGLINCCQWYKGCQLFYDIYTSDNCSEYRSPAAALGWGDPHLTTLDGNKYTFNGLGDYYLLVITDMLQIQCRTKRAVSRYFNATVFKSVAIQLNGSDKLEAVYDETANLNITLKDDGINSTGAGSILMREDGYVIVLNMGISVKVMATNGLLVITVKVPQKFHNQTKGLLGVYNGNMTDDFLLANNTVLNTPSEEALYEFGNSWKVNESESLFSGNIGNDSLQFDPTFFSEILSNMTLFLANESKEVEQLCGNNSRCMIDFVTTRNSMLANNTKIIEEMFEEERQKLQNRAPIFYNKKDFVYKNEASAQNVVINLLVSDPDFGDSVRIELDTNLTDADYTFTNTTFIWKSSAKFVHNTHIRFIAYDRMNASAEFRPLVTWCRCIKGKCDYTRLEEKFRFQYQDILNKILPVFCICTPYSPNCDKDICEIQPCYEDAACNSSLSNPCGMCPYGLKGDGRKCYDVNMCQKMACGQICQDFTGDTYQCSCRDGYRLNNNNITCDDIDECAEGSYSCHSDQYCMNTKGGYQCVCKPGFYDMGSSCISVFSQNVYKGQLSFRSVPRTIQQLTNDLSDPKSMSYKNLTGTVQNILNRTFASATGYTNVFVDKLRLQQGTQRRKRDTAPAATIAADFTVLGSLALKLADLNSLLNKSLVCNSSCSLGSLLGIVKSSVMSENLCLTKLSVCDQVSTKCMNTSGSYTCKCKEGFEVWDEYRGIRCKDINECQTDNKCGKARCNNTIGGYNCLCDKRHRFENKDCIDVCAGDPCKNGGTCLQKNSTYACLCTLKWGGENCEVKNELLQKSETDLIIVAVVLGIACVLFIMFILCLFCKLRNRNGTCNIGGHRTCKNFEMAENDRMRANLAVDSGPSASQPLSTFNFQKGEHNNPAFEGDDLSTGKNQKKNYEFL